MSLNKKHNVISFHRVCEAAAAFILLFAWVNTHCKLADVLTKNLPGPKFRSFTSYYSFGKGTEFTKGSDKAEKSPSKQGDC